MNKYDLVINNGRVIDIESKIDGIVNIGIKNGKIKTLTRERLEGKVYIDASGLIVLPGFIDIHTHEDETIFLKSRVSLLPTETSKALLRTGVTTMIGGNCGFGAYPVGPYLNEIDVKGLPTNYGTLVGYNTLREMLNINRYSTSTKTQLEKLKKMVQRELSSGALGVSFGLQYSPGTSTEEVIEISRIVRKFNKYIAVHIRYDYPRKAIDAVREIEEIARSTGVSIQISHLVANVYGNGNIKEALDLLQKCARDGLNITADVYPYDAWGTSIKSAVFDRGWLGNYNFSYEDIEVITGPHAGERCTPELFNRLRSQDEDTMVACHNAIPVDDIKVALKSPLVFVASDAQMTKNPTTNELKGHPRSAGTSAKLIGDMVMKKALINLKDAIRKLTLDPANKLKLFGKGRLQETKDADVTILDLNRIIDKSKFGVNVCALPPEGIEYVVVHGQIVCKDKKIEQFRGKSIGSKVKYR